MGGIAFFFDETPGIDQLMREELQFFDADILRFTKVVFRMCQFCRTSRRCPWSRNATPAPQVGLARAAPCHPRLASPGESAHLGGLSAKRGRLCLRRKLAARRRFILIMRWSRGSRGGSCAVRPPRLGLPRRRELPQTLATRSDGSPRRRELPLASATRRAG